MSGEMPYYGYREEGAESDTSGGSESDGGESDSEGGLSTETSVGQGLPFPGFVPVALGYLTQETRPRSWCLKLITNPWFERISMLVILLNCVTLGMYQPCVDDQCVTNRCKILQVFDDVIFAFFTIEMAIKMVAMGTYGHGTYLADSWNRLDCFIVLAGSLEYGLNVENINLSAIRTIRVLRPLRAINRIPSMRILVMLLLDTLPMLGNVLLLCFFVFFIFGIVGVQLWEGILRQRCELVLPPNVLRPNISFYYEFSKELDYICTTPEDNGMHYCGDFPPYRYGPLVCNETAKPFSYNTPTNISCVNWNQYYTNCTQRGSNPFQGTISFDNIGLAWVAIFLVISLEGWTDIMYYVQDAHSFWDWIYFVLLIVIGSFFMINLCLVVIATQFAETKKREMERMRAERARFNSTSTLASSTNNSEPATCYAEIVKYVAHLYRRFKRRMAKKIRVYRYQRAQLKWRTSKETLQLPANKPKQHHPCCPKAHPQQTNVGKTIEEGGEEPLSRPSLLRVPSLSAADLENASNLSLLSPPSLARRRSSVMFSDTVLLHTPNSPHGAHPHNVCSSEKMTQTEFDLPTETVEDRAAAGGTMSCQELLALSGALSAALPTGQVALDSFFEELTKGISKRAGEEKGDTKTVDIEDYSCCAELLAAEAAAKQTKKTRLKNACSRFWRRISKFIEFIRVHIKKVVDHKYFQQGILLAILINTLSMGIEYHNQPEELTVIVEISNIVFSAIFAVEMLFKICAEGPFKYIANGFNVFDGIIVILSAFELAQSYGHEKELAGNSGLSVLRTFRLLRILKLVRFMPNLRRQLFVMLRTMDNVAVFFSLLVLFIFIFSILGMYLFGGKFCKYVEDNGAERDCTCPEIVSHHPKCECDRKHFNNILWATVTVFQVLTQEDWNVVLFNGMEKTSHWAALYFVALMTFGNYVLFNLLVAILVEGFSSERNERREREQRELAKSKLSGECFSDNNEFQYDDSNSGSHSSESISQNEIKNYWRSADDVRKAKDDVNGHKEKSMRRRKTKSTHHPTLCRDCAQSNKCNLQKEKMLARGENAGVSALPMITHTAATPQDSPSTTLEPGATFRDFNMALSLERSSMLSSLDSIDRTSSASIPGLLKPPNSYTLTLHSAQAQLGAEKARLPPMSLAPPPLTLAPTPLTLGPPSVRSSPAATPTTPKSLTPILQEKNLQVAVVKEKDDNCLNVSDKSSLLSSQKNISVVGTPANGEDKCRVQRGYSWRLSRPSLRRKPKPRTGSDSDAIVLNNGRDHAVCNGSSFRKNEILLSSSMVIKNDTQSEMPNNRTRPQLPAPRVLAPPVRRVSAHNAPLLPDVSWKAPEAGFADSTARFESKPPPHRLSLTNDYLTITTVSEVKASNLISPPPLPPVTARATINEVVALPTRPNNQPLPLVKQINEEAAINNNTSRCIFSSRFDRRQYRFKDLFRFMEPTGCLKEKEYYSLYIFAPDNKMRQLCTWMVSRGWFDNIVLLFIALNCITLAMERPNIPPDSKERAFLSSANYVFTVVFAIEMFIKVVDSGMFYGHEAYFTSGWNIMDGSLVIISIIDLLMSLVSESSPRIFGILRVFRLLRSLRPLRVINRAPGLKLVVQTLLSSLRPIGNIVLICCTFFIIFGILGVQLFKGAFYYCEGANIKNVKNKTDCLAIKGNVWVNRKYNFDDLGKALMSLFVLSSKDGWVDIMYTGLDAVGVDQQLFKGALFYCEGANIKNVKNKTDCLAIEGNVWVNRKYNFDDLGKALMSLFVLSSKDGWVNIMYTGLDAVGVDQQLFKGTFYFCEGANITNVKNKTDCLAIEGNVWVNRKYNFDDLGQALMSLFVLSSKDGWVNIMYTGIDAVGVDQQPIVNYSEWRLLYFIAFILLVGFFVLNMFVGVVVENFHRCREEQEKEERVRRAAKRALQMEKKRRKMHQRPYYADYSQYRLFVHNVVTSKYFDLAIAGVIGLNVVTMAIEYYRMPPALQYALKIFNYFFTAVFILEAIMKLVALGIKIYMKDKWNQLDVGIVILSIIGIVLEELESNIIPINPTIMRVMRVLRIARVLKLLKMAKGIRALLDTVMQALPQVGNLGLLFFLLFFIFAALGVELFGRLECSDEIPCQGLGEHAHFANFGMAFLTLFRVATGDNWNGIMKDTLREDCDSSVDCVRNCCVSTIIAPIFFVVFVLMAQFVLVNVVVAVLMKHLEESHKQLEDEMDMDFELERELEREADDEEDRALCRALEQCMSPPRPISKVPSLPANFTYSEPKQPLPSPARSRRRTLHSHHALLPAALPPRRASLSPHAFSRRGRQDSTTSETPAALYEEDARFIDADDVEELEPGSPPRRDSFAQNRRQRADKRNSLRGEETRLLRPVLLAVPSNRQSLRLTGNKRKLSTESSAPSEASASPRSPTLPLPEVTDRPISEEEKIRIVIAERRKIDVVDRRGEPDDAGGVELAERGS